MTDLDALQQRASDNYEARLWVLLDAIQISAVASEMGRGAISSVASHLHYSSTTVRRLAAMHDLPQEAISCDTMPGAYWAAIQNDATPEQIRAAVEDGVETPAQMKKYLGIETAERKPRKEVCPGCGLEFEK